MRISTQSPIRFFYSHAGYSYDPKTETKLQGRWRCARSLAKAEREGKQAGLVFVWEYDQDPDVSWMDQDALDEWRSGSTEMLSCYVFVDVYGCRMCDDWEGYRRRHDKRPNILASLGGIHIDVDDKQHYRRVIQAELAQEALTELMRIGAEVNA